MDTLTLYLVLLLSGIIIGGMAVAVVLLPATRTRQYGYRPPLYPEAYEYGPYPARRPATLPATLFFLLLLLAAILLARQSSPEPPVSRQDTVEQAEAPTDSDGFYQP